MDHDCGEQYQYLEDSERLYQIKESNYQGSFDGNSIIEWAPLKGMFTESDEGYNL